VGMVNLDILSRLAVKRLLDTTTGQKTEVIRRIVGVRRALKLHEVAELLDGLPEADRTDESMIGYLPEGFEVPKADLQWLSDRLAEKDWSKHLDGQGHEITFPVSSAFLEGVDNLLTAVAEGLVDKDG
jgi:hypothetical protein